MTSSDHYSVKLVGTFLNTCITVLISYLRFLAGVLSAVDDDSEKLYSSDRSAIIVFLVLQWGHRKDLPRSI